jgi:small subunit ribosomal protein S9
MATKTEYFYGLGRRKAATARARLFTGKGTITVNEKKAADYFADNEEMLADLVSPLTLIGKDKAYDITGLLKRDPREKESKKYGLRSARKREQFSKR